MKPMGELVSAIAKSLVENPEAVEVSEEQSNGHYSGTAEGGAR